MARPKSNDKEVTVSVKISAQLKDSISTLAELQETDFSGYVRQVLQADAKQKAALIQQVNTLKKNYAAGKSRILAEAKINLAQDSDNLKGGNYDE